ncbi:hypothetical protein [Gilliamella sp. Pas-s27]|uniref:hypothetical protein n=1 Tax=Gilliamella sp. Pas-s27 TaxID=2687311 RepID=UPI0013659E10|nr:hypothetical protein [Gilliamella sp. Pas-s27]MWP45829.1 hypothetical protein [Gilliamella sp. Pas-s27]
MYRYDDVDFVSDEYWTSEDIMRGQFAVYLSYGEVYGFNADYNAHVAYAICTTP